MSSITRFLPKNHLSYLTGLLVHIRLPAFLNRFIIANFAKAYHIRLDEAELSYEQYPSLGEFFVRKLKPGLRPLGQTWALHPADSVITQAAVIREGQLVQAKNKFYTLPSFTRDQESLKKYDNGFFLTYYLCPTDYHRVHSPVTGKIKRVLHIPGALWPVNSWSTENVHELFSINERVVVEIETDRGLVSAVFVGATNVGKIELAFDREIIGNQLIAETIKEKSYQNLPIKKGEELGLFRMGSTVVMIYAPGTINPKELSGFHGKPVKVNSDFSN